MVGTSIAHLVSRIRHTDEGEYWKEWRVIGTIVMLVITVASIVPVVGLLGYHCRLIWLSRTTIEMVSPAYWGSCTDLSHELKSTISYAQNIHMKPDPASPLIRIAIHEG